MISNITLILFKIIHENYECDRFYGIINKF